MGLTCAGCGIELPSDALECDQCGERLPSQPIRVVQTGKPASHPLVERAGLVVHYLAIAIWVVIAVLFFAGMIRYWLVTT